MTKLNVKLTKRGIGNFRKQVGLVFAGDDGGVKEVVRSTYTGLVGSDLRALSPYHGAYNF